MGRVSPKSGEMLPPEPEEIVGSEDFVTMNAVDLMAQFAKPCPHEVKTPNGFLGSSKSLEEHFTQVDIENAFGPVGSADCKLLPYDLSFPPLVETRASAGIFNGLSLFQYESDDDTL
jgi:hypothetical protein